MTITPGEPIRVVTLGTHGPMRWCQCTRAGHRWYELEVGLERYLFRHAGTAFNIYIAIVEANVTGRMDTVLTNTTGGEYHGKN